MPLALILRDMLKVCDNAREAKEIINSRKVLIDGRIVTDPKFPVGLMDVLSLQASKEHYRMLLDYRGRLQLVPIDDDAAEWKLVRIENKITVKGGKLQLNLGDGRNILLSKDGYKTRGTLKITVPDQKILEHYPLEPGSFALLTGGKHAGELARVKEYRVLRSPKANEVLFEEGFSTVAENVFVVGSRQPQITLPQASAVR